MALDISNYNPRFQSSYNAVSSIANGQPVAQNQVQPQQQYNEPMRQMTDGERLFASLANIGNSLSESTGFSRYYQDNGGLASLASPEGFTRFAMNLPAGMASALPTGVANLYAAGTGSDVVYGSDLTNNMIREEKLDAGQRVASAITGGIDTLGLAVGGSGSLINEIGRAWKAGRGLEAAAKTGAGARALNLTGSSFANRGVMTPGQAFAFDVAEEAGEEAVQSVSEDVIQKQLDEGTVGRAFEGAFMGGLGGGMMSGGALALRSATNSDIKKAQSTQTQKTPSSFSPFAAGNELRNSNLAPGSIFAPVDAAEAMNKKLMGSQTAPVAGSITATVKNSGAVTTVDDTIVGIEEFRAMWRQSISAEDQIHAFFTNGQGDARISKDALKEIIFRDDQESAAKILNSLLENSYGATARQVTMLRNPATTNGSVYLNVEKIGTGSGFDMSGSTIQLLGGDFDGDKAQLFLSSAPDGYKAMAWASELMLSDEAGGGNKSLIDYSFSALSERPSWLNEEDVRGTLREKIENLTVSGGVKLFSDQQVSSLVDEIMQAYLDESDARNERISLAMHHLQKTAGEAFATIAPGQDIRTAQRLAVNNVFAAFAENKWTPSNVVDFILDNLKNAIQDMMTNNAPGTAESAGNAGLFKTAAAGFQIGIKARFTEADFNQFYRNYATMVYDIVKNHPVDLAGYGIQTGPDTTLSAYAQLVLAGCHVTEMGADPVKSITHIIDNLVAAEFSERWGKSLEEAATLTAGDRENVIKAFAEAYNSFVDEFNSCMTVITSSGLTESWLAPTREPISAEDVLKMKTDSRGHASESVIKFGKEFLRMFPSYPLSNFIPESVLPNRITPGLGTYDAASIAVVHDISIDQLGVGSTGDVSQAFFFAVVEALKSEGDDARRRFISAYQEFAPSFASILARYKKNGNKIDPNDVESLRTFTNWFMSVVNVDAAIAAGFLDPERWIGTRIGEAVLSGDWKQAINAATVIDFYGKFIEFVEFRETHGNQKFNEEQLDRLAALASIDVVHAEIVNQLKHQDENGAFGTSPILQMLVNLDTTFDSKQEMIVGLFKGSDASVEGRLYLSSISGSPDMNAPYSDDSISTKMRKGLSYVSQYKKTLYTNLENEARDLRTLFVTNSALAQNVSLSSIMEMLLRRDMFNISMEPVAMVMADMANVTNKQPEKGTATLAGGALYVMMDMQRNGKQTSADADTFNTPLGNSMLIDLAQNPSVLARILRDPTYSIWVFDEQGRSCEFNQAALFSAASKTYRSGNGEITDLVWIELFESLPNLLSYFGGVGASFASTESGVSTTLGSTGSLLDYCNSVIAERTRGSGNEDAVLFEQRADELVPYLLDNLQTYKYIFAKLPQNIKFATMQGKQPPASMLWSIAKDLARGVLMTKITDGPMGQSGSRTVSQEARRLASDRLELSVQGLYSSIIAGLQSSADLNIGKLEGLLSTAFSSSSMLVAMSGVSSISYNYGGQQKAFDPNSLSANGKYIASEFSSSFNELTNEAQEKINEMIGVFATMESILGVFEDGKEFKDELVRSLVVANYGRDEAMAIADAAFDSVSSRLSAYKQEAIDKIGLSPFMFAKTDDLFTAYNPVAFLDKLAKLGRFSHDETRFNMFIESVRSDLELGGDPSLCREAAELFEMYQNLFDDTNARQTKAPTDPDTRWSDFEKLAVKFAGKALAIKFSDYAGMTGKINPFMLDDSYEYIDFIDSLLANAEISEKIASYGLINAKTIPNGEEYLEMIKEVPRVDYQEEAAYANQLMESVLSGRVISEVGINGSELMKTAMLSVIPGDRQLPSEIVSKHGVQHSGQDLIDGMANFRNNVSDTIQIDPRSYVYVDGKLEILEDLEREERIDLAKTDYIVIPRSVNPHGIYLGPIPAPLSADYGLKYRSVLGALNKFHMTAMEQLVLKTKKQGKEDTRYTRKRNAEPASREEYKSQEEFLTNALSGYYTFVTAAAKNILDSSMYKSDLAKIKIGQDEIEDFVRMMTVGYRVQYVTQSGETKQAIIDINHAFIGDMQQQLGKVVGDGSFVSAELFVVPLQAINYRIANAVNKVESRSTEDQEKAAFTAMTNWDDYAVGSISALDVARRFSPLGKTHNSLIAERTPTALQNLINDIYADLNNPKSGTSKTWQSKPRHHVPGGSDEHLELVSKTRNLFKNVPGTETVVTNVFGLPHARPGIHEAYATFGMEPATGDTFDYAYDLLKSLQRNDIAHVGGNEIVVLLDTNPQSSAFKDAVAFASVSGARIVIPATKPLPNNVFGSSLSLYGDMVLSDGTGRTLPMYELRLPRQDIVSLFDTMAASRSNYDVGAYTMVTMVDEHGRYRRGDASSAVSSETASRFVARNAPEALDVDLRSIIQSEINGPFEFVSPNEDDFNSLIGLDPNDPTQWESFRIALRTLRGKESGLGFLADGDNYIRTAVKDYLEQVKSQHGAINELVFSGSIGGSCVGLVKAIPLNGAPAQYIPIMVPKNITNVESCSFAMGGNPQIVYQTREDFSKPGVQLFMKLSLFSKFADKSMAVTVDPSELPRGVDAVENVATISARMQGRDDVILYTNLFNFMNSNYMNMFFAASGENGRMDFSQAWKDFFANDKDLLSRTMNGSLYSSSGKSLWDLLLEDDSRAWAAVFDGTSVQTVRIKAKIKQMIKDAYKYNIPIESIFGVSNYAVSENWQEETDASGNKTGRMLPVLESISKLQTIPQIDLLFQNMQYDDICDFYAVIGHNFNLMSGRDWTSCTDDNPQFKFRRDGRMFIEGVGYSKVLIDSFAYMGHVSTSETPGNAAAIGEQQRVNKLMMYGVDTSTYEYIKNLAMVQTNDPRAYTSGEKLNLDGFMSDRVASMDEALFDNYYEFKRIQELKREFSDDLTWRRDVIGRDGKVIDLSNLDDSPDQSSIKTAISNLRNATGANLSIADIHRIVNHIDGSTRGDFENTTIYAGTFASHINRAAKNFREYGLLVIGEKVNGRVSIATFDPSFIRYFCNLAKKDFDTYVKAMWEQEKISYDLALQLTKRGETGKKVVLLRLLSAMRWSWNDDEHSWRDNTFAIGGVYAEEWAQSDGVLKRIFESLGYDTDAFEPLQNLSRKLMSAQQKIFENKDNQRMIKSDQYVNGKLYAGPSSTESFVSRGMDGMVTFTRAMAVANPGVVAGNLAGRVASQTYMDLLLDLGAKAGIGPFAASHHISNDTLEFALNDQDMIDAYLAAREAGITGDDDILSSSANVTELVTRLSEMRQGRTGGQKLATKVFSIANGGNFALRQQIGLFYKRLIHFIEAEPALASYLEINKQTGRMVIEDKIIEDPAGFFLSCFVPQGRPELYVCAMQAMNSAMTGDMAQRHWLATFLHHALKDHPVGRFIFSTTICKFPRYQFNLVDKALNWFAPMSTLNYILTHAAAEWDERQAQKAEAEGREYTRFGFVLDQRFVNAREAMAYDVAHMGPMIVAAVLLSVGNAIEPPDDEKKWGDPDEWIICGSRIGESWWIGDLLGTFVPSILYTKSCMLGRPTSSLLVNGALGACYGNPFLRASDTVDILINWNDGENTMSYLSALEQYQNAEGGAPGLLDWLSANSVSLAANMVTGTVIPSWLKEIYRNSQTYEKSYKKVYATDSTGKLSESGANGVTKNTDYFDAQIRRACRNNPFLAVIMDLLHTGDGTGYLLSEMPNTVYYDDKQMDSMDYWSIKDLDEQKAEEKLFEIMLLIEGNSFDDLQKSGFYLDKETLYALGSYLWDCYYGCEKDWDMLGEQGALSYTLLGNGSYDAGKQRYYELLNIKNAQKDGYKNLYNSIKNSYLSRGPQQYWRYTTSYRTDSEGNVYATGYHRQGVLPFVTAPGTTTNPEGTAGYENDFASISAVTGQPMDQRALVPIPGEYIDLPAFAGFSAKGDGEGYSGKWSRYAGTTPKNSDGQPEGLTYPDGTPIPDAATINAASGTPRYGGGSGGGGGSRRSSGSPSTYVPGISSRNYAPNTPNAATARASRAYDAQFDYLRPNVETKGSRDAYKRGDM